MALEQTSISIDVVTFLILHSAASSLARINRAKNRLKGVDTQDEALQTALTNGAEKVRQAIGE
jgi:hypothetical protein